MIAPDWVSILPPLLAIFIAVASRQVILSLGFGIWLGCTLLSDYNPLAGLRLAIDETVNIMSDAGNARVILFVIFIGSLILIIEQIGGIRGLVFRLEKLKLVTSARESQWLAWLTGIVIFIESTLTLMIAGSISRPLFDRFRVSREKLAYIIDSTSAPICILIPVNAWGAFNIGLLDHTNLEQPLTTFTTAILFNFYALIAVAMVAFTIIFNWNPGAMRKAEKRTQGGQLLSPNANLLSIPPPQPTADANTVASKPNEWFMILPFVAMIVMVFIGLYITGDGVFSAGSGSISVLWGVLFGLAVVWIMALVSKRLTLDALIKLSLQGAGNLLPIAVILALALTLGHLTGELGTGEFMAQVLGDNISTPLLPLLIFWLAAVISFSIGSSWGTFAIMIPVAIPIALALDASAPLFLGALLAGSIFGDHCSPISDTTVIASMAAHTDHIDHVRTQLPYALVSAALASVLYLLAGFFV